MFKHLLLLLLLARRPFALLGVFFALGLVGFAAHAGYGACYPAPLSDAQMRANYKFAQQVARANPAQLREYARRAHGEVSSGAELKRRMVRYVAKPLNFYLNEMRKYRVACARADRGDGGGYSKPSEPTYNQCSSPHQCGGSTQCINGRCEQKGSVAGNCRYGACPTGYRCDTEDGICK